MPKVLLRLTDCKGLTDIIILLVIMVDAINLLDDNFILINITETLNNITTLQPESQERLCPDQTVVYQCNISKEIFSLT